jgi:hypothetical protein
MIAPVAGIKPGTYGPRSNGSLPFNDPHMPNMQISVDRPQEFKLGERKPGVLTPRDAGLRAESEAVHERHLMACCSMVRLPGSGCDRWPRPQPLAACFI